MLGQSYHGLTRPPLSPAVLGLIVGLQDPDKISHARSISVFGNSLNLSVGRALAPLPKPHYEIGDVSHGVLSAANRGSRHQSSGNGPLGRKKRRYAADVALQLPARKTGSAAFTLDLLVAPGTRLAPLRVGMMGPYLGWLGLGNRIQS